MWASNKGIGTTPRPSHPWIGTRSAFPQPLSPPERTGSRTATPRVGPARLAPAAPDTLPPPAPARALRSSPVMAKLFYTLDEAASKLKKNPDEIKAMVRSEERRVGKE